MRVLSIVSRMSRLYTIDLFSADIDASFDLFFFFFQAEDGIRDLVRSRGLGDVYKRQGEEREHAAVVREIQPPPVPRGRIQRQQRPHFPGPVSYTHLTLPTSDLV